MCNYSVFGPREEIIINNGGMGMGGTTIIEERGGCKIIFIQSSGPERKSSSTMEVEWEWAWEWEELM